ncbi:MAG: putative integral membrane protein [Phormidesmis priestleyi Ana]|uniref:Putative integral membrane protein n=1 Tax=Phormidesmis priestleyi Ana TaxID=1666911 RepID=A0A0P7YTA6_9CYAN|nr:MAG: putative integral membrane protein [Phormidesmis priestleyi Ana]
MEETVSSRNIRQGDDRLAPKTDENKKAGINDTERWASLIMGGAMVLRGLQSRSLQGVIMAIAGGGLAYHGTTSDQSLPDKLSEAAGLDQDIRVEKTVTINKPVEMLYSYWRNLENLPRFMSHLESIQTLDETRSHWKAKAPMNMSVEWDAEIVEDRPNQLIAWTAVADADVPNAGFVRFKPAPGDRGTEVKVVIEYSPPGGALTAAVAKLFGEEPEQQVGDALSKFKQLMEAGEIATVEGQSKGH